MREAAAGGSQEARTAARIDHPHVVQIFDLGEADGQLFIAMEHVTGSNLTEWLDQHPPWKEIIERFTLAGRGLQAAHTAGLVHRDFKPDIDHLCTELQRARVEITRLRDEVDSYQRFAVETQQRLVELQQRCEEREAMLLGSLLGWFMNQLKIRRDRLEVYQNQARYAFADSYDRAAKAQGAEPVAEVPADTDEEQG